MASVIAGTCICRHNTATRPSDRPKFSNSRKALPPPQHHSSFSPSRSRHLHRQACPKSISHCFVDFLACRSPGRLFPLTTVKNLALHLNFAQNSVPPTTPRIPTDSLPLQTPWKQLKQTAFGLLKGTFINTAPPAIVQVELQIVSTRPHRDILNNLPPPAADVALRA